MGRGRGQQPVALSRGLLGGTHRGLRTRIGPLNLLGSMTCPPWVISARPMATRRRAAIRAGSISSDQSSEPTARAASDGHTEALGDRPSSKDSKEASSCRSTSPMPCLRQLSEHQRTESQSRAQTLRQVMLRPHRAQGLDGRAGRAIPEVCPETSPRAAEAPPSIRRAHSRAVLRTRGWGRGPRSEGGPRTSADAGVRIDGERPPLPLRSCPTYRRCMAVATRIGQVLLALVALFSGLAFVVAMGSSTTGPVEKVSLLVGAALFLWASFAVPRFASRLRARRRTS